ncbi:MAG: prolyl oligopeptidase family serine peptidase [Armatimonadota bacterium]
MFPILAGLILAPDKFSLTVESIMRGYELVGHSPSNLRWSDDGSKIGFQWAKADGTKTPATKSYIVNRDGTGLSEGSLPPKETKEWDFGSKVGNQIAYASDGDIWVRDTVSESSENLTKTPESESNPILTQDGTSIIFTRNGDLYRYALSDKKTQKLTQSKASSDPSVLVTLEPTKGAFLGRLTTSPLGSHVAVSYFESPEETSRNAQIARFITSSGYVELSPTYPRVGSPQGKSSVKLFNFATGKSVTIAPPRAGRVDQIKWAPDGKNCAIWASSEDNKDGWLYGFNAETEVVTTLWNEHDDAWVGGPAEGVFGWLPDSSKVYFESESNGFANLYEVDPGGTKVENIVAGPFEVTQLQLDKERQRFIFVSSEGSPFDRHIDSVKFDGSTRTKLADFSAGDDASFAMSPNGGEIAIVKSSSNRPAELYVKNVAVTQTPSAEWLSGPWIDPPIIQFPSRDGTKVPAKLFKSKNWRKGGPAVVFVHGAGYLQNVFHGWSYYYREYMFHHLLMERGYAVLDVDYRASSGYGKAWRTGIYRHMGGKDLEDIVDGAQYLVKEIGAAPDRLGVYGGSYGGFITFMAMFTTPDVFKSGAALRPVGDWANYHHGYTSPILNTPKEDPDAFKMSSPINFVEGLKGNLLICHGMVDSNVQFQDSIRIVQRLIDLGKVNWEVAPYPVEDHSFVRPESWTDEYRRILALFERTIGTKRVKS